MLRCKNKSVELFLFGFSGTTEKIFEEKKELYDVYIDNQNVKTHRESLQPLLRLNSADREKYRKLCEQRYVSLLKPQKLMGKKSENIFFHRHMMMLISL